MQSRKVEYYTTNDPKYKGRDALVFSELDECFYPIYCHESADWELQMGDIAQTSILRFFYVNLAFYKRFASRITDELNKRGKGEIKPILKKIFEQQPEPD